MKDPNENRTGYKKTKVGWIPDDWQVYKIKDTGNVQAGRQRSPHFVKGELRPYLRVANIQEGYIDTSDVLQMMFTKEEFQRYQLTKGDILLNEGQSLDLVGRCAVYEGSPPNCCFQNTLIRFRANCLMHKQYGIAIFTYLQKSGAFAKISSQTTSIAHLGVSRFANLQIPLPQKAEQQKIAKILSTWDTAINQTRSLINKKKTIKKALAIRFFNQKKYSICKLKDVAEVNKQTLSESTDPEFQFYYIDITSIKDGRCKENLKLTRFFLAPSRARRLFFKGDILMSTVRPNLKNYLYVNFNSSKYVCSTGFAVVSPKNNINGYFLYQLLFSDTVQKQCHACVSGSNYPAMSQKDVERIKLKLPGIEYQKKVANILSSCDEEIDILQKKLLALEKQKRALMQHLLTGRVRVNTLERG